MLRAIIVCPDQELSLRLEELFTDVGRIASVRSVGHYPAGHELERLLRAHAPHAMFLSVDSMAMALETAERAEKTLPGIQIVACSRTCDHDTLLELMRVGVREFLAPPLRSRELALLVDRLEDRLSKSPISFDATDLVFCFLPAKAGVGTSTIAVNSCVALSHLPDTKVLLLDFDMNSGLISFMLKLDNPFTVVDAAEKSASLDEKLWPQLVSSIGSMDVLASGGLNPEFRIEPVQIRQILAFARRMYKVIGVDLSGNMEKYSIELMLESKRIFLVCTPEIPSLHLARERYNFLCGLDIGDRVSVLLNRWHKRASISAAQVEELLGVPVHATFPNDYRGVHNALTVGRAVDPNSELGKQFGSLAQRMIDPQPLIDSTPRQRFVEYFSIVPARYTLFPENK